MRIKNLFMSLLFLLGVFQINAQTGFDDGKKNCLNFAQVTQECNDNGTVSLTFRISNNSTCTATGVTIIGPNGLDQSYAMVINGQTSSSPITYTTASAGSELCLEVILHEGGGKGKIECCRETVCLQIDCCELLGCCNMEANLVDVGGCDPNAWARVMVTGGTQPYIGPPNSFQAGIVGNFIIKGLSGGSHTFTFTDSEECEVEITMEMPENDMEAVLVEIGGCGEDDRSVSIAVSGGAAPYTGPPNSTNDGQGDFFIDGLSTGSHTFTFEDDNGCGVDITVYISTGDCSPLHHLYQNETTTPIPTIISEVSATIRVQFAAYCIPDMVEVYINDGYDPVLQLIAGEGGCNQTDYEFGTDGYFCVEPCDIVEFVVTPNVCPGQFNCNGATATVYDILTECVLKDGNGGQGGSRSANDKFAALRKNNRELTQNKTMISNAQQSLKVYPNPVTNVLNIFSSNSTIEYQIARIMNSAGQVVRSVNRPDIDGLQIDVSAFSRGVYFIELTDVNGNQVVEKFMKLD